MNADEHKLVALAREGDHTAMEGLYMQNKEKIFSLAYRYVGNRQDAEDLLQDIFSKAFTALMEKKFTSRADAGFSTWLYRIGINCSISYLRKNKKYLLNHLDTGEDTDPFETVDSGDPGPEHSASMREVRETVNSGLGCLSGKQRMMFVLRFYQGLQVNEIARYMNCSEGSVKKQIFRAVSKLREKLTFYTEGVGGRP